ncbi:MAG: heme-binding protein [Actinomycetota bacterium]|nr:heme-binding protein [Actinomycetota bacterium]
MTEEQAYDIVQTFEEFELRRYAPHVVAEVVVRGEFEDAGNMAFRTLFGYISGQNRSGSKVAMTSPVIQREPEQIAMTAPVQQRETSAGEYAVAFVLPSSFTLGRAPVPTSPEVQLHQRAAALAAAHRYRGRWTQASFEHQCRGLQSAVRAAGLTPVGSPRWARFDPPFVPWFLRRNEVVQDVTEGSAQDDRLSS